MSKLYTALVTPFLDDLSIDIEGLRKNIQFQIESKTEGVVLLGTTGEAPTIENEEKKELIRAAVEEVEGTSVKLIVGAGSYSTAQTIRNCKEADDLGADELLIVTPYYNKPTQEGLFGHFSAIAECTSLPIIVYNIQGRTGVNMQNETLFRLVENCPNIIGVKECSGSVAQLSELIETKRNKGLIDFSVFCGDDPLILPAFALGADGIISVAGNVYPREIKGLLELIEEGEIEYARKKYYALLPFLRALFLETNPIPVKEAMNMLGMPAGPCRMPLCKMGRDGREQLERTIETSINR